MHFRVVTKTTIKQNPSVYFPNRKKTFSFDFVHEFEAEDSWTSLTNKAKLTLPKNIYTRDETNRLIPLGLGVGAGVPDYVNLGGFGTNDPLFLRGDSISFEAGYRFFDAQGNDTKQSSVWFTGYISEVKSKIPFTLECEDNMWQLKQIVAPNKGYKRTDTVEDILKDLLQGTTFTVNVLTKTTIGNFRTQGETVCEVLARLRKDYYLESYFRGNELRCGSLVYIEQDAIKDGDKYFTFQQNIIKDDLQYRRKDDINLSCIAYSVNKKELVTTTKDGHKKTKSERLEVLVTQQKGKFVVTQKPPGQKADFAPNTAGERTTLHFFDITDPKKLGQKAIEYLQLHYYTGFKGKFTTFGIPYVRQGDNVVLTDPKLVERNGKYKVRSVQYSAGIGGLRQTIELEYKIK